MKRLADRCLLLFAAFLVFAAAAPLLFADSSVRIVRLSYVDGDVQIDQRDGQGFETAYINMPVTPGTRIQTRADSRAEIELEDGSTIRLAPDSLVEFTSMGLRSDGSRDTMVDLEGGTAYIDLRHQRDDDFRLNFAHETVTLHHSVRFRVSLDDGHAVIVPIKGDLEVLNENGKTLDVRKGETLTIDLTDPDHFYRANTAESGPADAWDQEREDYRNTYVERTNSNRYQADYQDVGYNYGATDLNYYGAYSYVPGYGWMWQPTYMPVGWNPYMDGAWVFYPGFGWQWVSAYPWGWMPYHYGSWFFVSGRGWCWHPGHRHEFWRPAPVVASAPPHFNPPGPPVHNPPAVWHRVPPGHQPPAGSQRVVVVGRGPTVFSTRIRDLDSSRDDRLIAPPRPVRVVNPVQPPNTPGNVVTMPPANKGGTPLHTEPPITRDDVRVVPPAKVTPQRPDPPVTTGNVVNATPSPKVFSPPPPAVTPRNDDSDRVDRNRVTPMPTTPTQPPVRTYNPPPQSYSPPPPAQRTNTPPPQSYSPPPQPTQHTYTPPPTPAPRPVTPSPSTSTTSSRPSTPPPAPPPPPRTGGTKTDHPR